MVEESETSGKIKELLEQAQVLVKERKLDQAIETHTYMMVLAEDDPSITLDQKISLRRARGNVYGLKGNYELAIQDFTHAIKIKPDFVDSYIDRGMAYTSAGKYDQAIQDFNDAFKLVPNYAVAYNARGITYNIKEDYDRAIKYFNEALKQNSDYADAYYNRGLSYLFKGQIDRAINDLNKTLKLQSNHTDAWRALGITYCEIGKRENNPEHYRKAYKYFRKSNEISPRIKSEDTVCYIASKAKSPDIFRHLYELYDIVIVIKHELIKPSVRAELVAHYTGLNTLKELAQEKPFRLYNAAYMSDPEEGKTLLEELGFASKKSGRKDNFLSEIKRSPAYVGSFVKLKTEKKSDDEKLFLWRTYGKHEEQEAGGTCLHFDISRFSNHPPVELAGVHSTNSENISVSPQTLQKEYIYEIIYKSDIKSKGLSPRLEELKKILNKIRGKKWDENNEIHLLARNMLDEIRFLFKADHYREEKELRIVKIRHFSNEFPKDVKIDADTFPPRFYMETLPALQLKKVILGPQAQGYLEWEQWIKEHNDKLEIEQSKTKYGRQFF